MIFAFFVIENRTEYFHLIPNIPSNNVKTIVRVSSCKTNKKGKNPHTPRHLIKRHFLLFEVISYFL